MEDEIITKEISWCQRTIDRRMEDERFSVRDHLVPENGGQYRMEDEIITKEISWCQRTIDRRMEDERFTVRDHLVPENGGQ